MGGPKSGILTNATSGTAVTESDLPTIKDKLAQHHADGFLLVTTTVPGVAAKQMLDNLDKSNGGDIYTWVWDKSELTRIFFSPNIMIFSNSSSQKATSE
jgi:hypothetical protein